MPPFLRKLCCWWTLDPGSCGTTPHLTQSLILRSGHCALTLIYAHSKDVHQGGLTSPPDILTFWQSDGNCPHRRSRRRRSKHLLCSLTLLTCSAHLPCSLALLTYSAHFLCSMSKSELFLILPLSTTYCVIEWRWKQCSSFKASDFFCICTSDWKMHFCPRKKGKATPRSEHCCYYFVV